MFGVIKWDVLLNLARENRIVIRLYERLLQLGVKPGEAYEDYVTEERQRIGHTLDLMERIDQMCEDVGLVSVFMKNHQHYPDMGDDIDLLVIDRNHVVDSIVAHRLDARPFKLSLLNQFGGKTQYYFENSPTYLEIHHGRVGRMGEHLIFPRFLVGNRRRVCLVGKYVYVPSSEDQIILQVLQRTYGRFNIRLSELVYLVSAIREDQLDWEYIADTTRKIGIFEGLRYYLSCVNAIHKRALGDVLPLDRPELLNLSVATKVSFKSPYYRLPWLTVGSHLYLWKLLADVEVSNWDGVVRLSLAPVFAVLVGGEVLLKRVGLKSRGKPSISWRLNTERELALSKEGEK